MTLARAAGALVVAAAVMGTACSASDAPKVTALTVANAWARTTPTGATNGVAYLIVTSPIDDTLIAVSVPAEIAAAATLHETMGGGGESPMPNMPEMTTPGGEMTMTPVDSVALPSGTPVAFEPGGKHIMLTGLTGSLTDGDRFELTLTFGSGATVAVSVVVADSQPASQPKG